MNVNAHLRRSYGFEPQICLKATPFEFLAQSAAVKAVTMRGQPSHFPLPAVPIVIHRDLFVLAVFSHNLGASGRAQQACCKYEPSYLCFSSTVFLSSSLAQK